MPTFQSLGLDPQLLRLFQPDQQHHQHIHQQQQDDQQHAQVTDDSECDDDHPNENIATAAPTSSSTTIAAPTTPHAVLSRDANLVAASLGMPRDVWNHVRNTIAERIISTTTSSSSSTTTKWTMINSIIDNDAFHQQESDNHMLSNNNHQQQHQSNQQQQQQQHRGGKENHAWVHNVGTEDGDDDDIRNMDCQTNDNDRQRRCHALPPSHSPFVVGTISVLDYYRQETNHLISTMMRSSPSSISLHHGDDDVVYHYYSLSTGSLPLDQLLACPREWQDARRDFFSLPYTTNTTSTTTANTDIHMSDDIDSNYNSSCNNNSTGGIPFGYITQFTGPPASGKTQIALQLALHHATNGTTIGSSSSSTARVYYMHHGSNRSLLRRLQVLLLSHTTTTTTTTTTSNPTTTTSTTTSSTRQKRQQEQEQQRQDILSRIHFQSISNVYQLLAVSAQIENSLLELQQQHQTLSSPPCLIILDSVSACLSSDLVTSTSFPLDDGSGSGAATSPYATALSLSNRALIHQVSMTLKRLARQYGAAIVLTNGTVQSRLNDSATTASTTTYDPLFGNWKPALEQVWQHVPDVQVWLQPHEVVEDSQYHSTTADCLKSNTTKRVRAMLRQHPGRSVPGSSSRSVHRACAEFIITPQGIRDQK